MHGNMFYKDNIIISAFAFLFNPLYLIGSSFLFKFQYFFFVIFLAACCVAEVFFNSSLSMSVKSVTCVSLLRAIISGSSKGKSLIKSTVCKSSVLRKPVFFSLLLAFLFDFFQTCFLSLLSIFFYNSFRSWLGIIFFFFFFVQLGPVHHQMEFQYYHQNLFLR